MRLMADLILQKKRISRLEVTVNTQKRKREENEQRVRKLWNNFKRLNEYVPGVPEGAGGVL